MIFDDILASCLEALEQGTPIDECLARYPAQAAALEPLLHVVVALRSEAQTRMSSQAFADGRNALRQRAQQQARQSASKTVQHRPPPNLSNHVGAPQQNHPISHARYAQNGASQARRPLAAQRSLSTPKFLTTPKSSWGSAMRRVLSTALLLVLLVGATSLTHRIMSSLPGTLFYPIKNVGEQGIGVLMQAAGEEIPWHATQAENGLQALAQLSQPEVATAQALIKVIEEHWKSVLTATQRLPVAERVLVLQSRITRLQQLEAEWTNAPLELSPTAVLTVRKMITAGEQLLAAPPAVETVATTAPTASPTTPSTPVQTPMLTNGPTTQPTATPLLQATSTLTSSPILVGTATPVATPMDVVLPATVMPSPTLLATAPPAATPMPVITAQMPQESHSQESNSQESNNQGSEDSDADEDKSNSPGSESAVSEPATNGEDGLTPVAIATIADNLSTPDSETALQTPTPVIPIDAPVATVEVTPVIDEPPATPLETTKEAVEESEALPVTTPVATSAESIPTPGKSTPSTAATPELLVAERPRPTHQPTATKTPKSTATPDKATVAAPDKTTTAPLATSTEKTPKPTAQPTETPRPTSSSNEATKVAQP